MTRRVVVPVDDRFLRDVDAEELERRRLSAEDARARSDQSEGSGSTASGHPDPEREGRLALESLLVNSLKAPLEAIRSELHAAVSDVLGTELAQLAATDIVSPNLLAPLTVVVSQQLRTSLQQSIANVGETLEAAVAATVEGVLIRALDRAVGDTLGMILPTPPQGVASGAQVGGYESADQREMLAAVEEVMSTAWYGASASRDAMPLAIELKAPNRPGLLASVLRILSKGDVGVRSARAALLRNSTVWLVIEADPMEHNSFEAVLQELSTSSGGTVAMRRETGMIPWREPLLEPAPMTFASAQVVIANRDPVGGPTTVQIAAADRILLLASVARVFDESDYELVAVDVESRATQSLGIFEIVDESGRALSSEAIALLEHAILNALTQVA